MRAGGTDCGLGARRPRGLTSVNSTLLAESTRRVGTAWPAAGSNGWPGGWQAGSDECLWMIRDVAPHNRLKLLKLTLAPKRFVVLAGQLVPLWGTGC